VFLFRVGRFGRMGPLGMAFMGYQMWRRLSPQHKAAIGKRVSAIAGQIRRGRDARRPEETSASSTMARVGSATAPGEEIPPTGQQGR
jgi:hypothetical protein